MAASTLEEPKLPGGYLVTPRVPQGLAAAVEGLTREIIRNSPEDIYVFAAHHFEKLLLLRDKCGGVEKSRDDRDGNLRTLREMSQALRTREFDRENMRTSRNTIDQVGWSLSQTAKVLKRHRSIFGDEGRRITTDEVFRMANQRENPSRSPKSSGKRIENRGKCSNRKKTLDESPNELWKASTSRTERSSSNDDYPDNNEVNSDTTRTGPRIITQIPNLPSGTGMLVKDIKTELRKNRISSRERRNVRAKPEERSSLEKSDDKVARSGSKNITSKKSDRQKRIEPEVDQKRSRRSHDTTRSSKGRQHDQESTNDDVMKNRGENFGTMSGERMKDFQRFATTRSLEELQTANYVEKVQEIIDETGPIIKEKIEELKSGMIGRSKKSSWFDNAQNNRARGSNDALNGKNESTESMKNSSEYRNSRVLSTDALRTRLTETQNLLENVSSSLTRSKRRSRSARSSRMRENIETEVTEELTIFKDPREDALSSESSNRGNGLETRLSKTRNLLEDISSTLSRPMRRSSSAKSLRKDREMMEEFGESGSKDILKKRLDETRNLLKGISASFARTNERIGSAKRLRNSGNAELEELSYSDGQMTSKVSLPAVRSISMRNSSGSVSRSDLDNLVLPAISPEVPRSAKIKEDLILPVLSSPSGTASTNEDSHRVEETYDDVFLEEVDIPEIPIENYVPEVVDNVSRDSLNVTPDLDSIPQRPDSLEPEEIVDDVETEILMMDDHGAKTSVVDDLKTKTPEINDLEGKLKGLDDLDAEVLRVDDLEAETSDDVEAKTLKDDDLENKSSGVNDLETRLQEIQEVERNIEEVFAVKSPSIDPASAVESENYVMRDKLRELEEAEKRIDTIFDKEICKGSKDSLDSKKEANQLVEITDISKNSGRNVDEEISEKVASKPSEVDQTEENVELPIDERKVDKLTIMSPECVNYTYILSEGSPYDIPDTVTTVIIPERNVESPLSDRLNVELEDGQEAKLSLISGDGQRKKSNEKIDDVERYVDYEKTNIIETRENSHDSDKKTRKEDIVEDLEIIEKTKNFEESDENDFSSKIKSDPFGEFVKPESIEESLTDIEFIREIESRQEMQMARQDLGRINEEMSEELEVLEESDKVLRIVENLGNVEETKEETLEIKSDPIYEEERKVDEKINVDDIEVEKLMTESDLSPATRPYVDSESSNEAKESSAADEPLDSGKCLNSLDDEEISDPRTPEESSNEVKETTLTDGLSFSLDPTRPFVPELNLDSLQDITVSSFKMTEDDYENQEPVVSGNTNSITETLTSDENNRIIDNEEFVDEAIMKILLSESARSNVEEKNDDERIGEEVVEEMIVKSQVEVKEDICEKTSTYVTGPSKEEEETGKDEAKLPVEEEKGSEEKEEEGTIEVADVEGNLVEEANVTSEALLVEEEKGLEEKKEEGTIKVADVEGNLVEEANVTSEALLVEEERRLEDKKEEGTIKVADLEGNLVEEADVTPEKEALPVEEEKQLEEKEEEGTIEVADVEGNLVEEADVTSEKEALPVEEEKQLEEKEEEGTIEVADVEGNLVEETDVTSEKEALPVEEEKRLEEKKKEGTIEVADIEGNLVEEVDATLEKEEESTEREKNEITETEVLAENQNIKILEEETTKEEKEEIAKEVATEKENVDILESEELEQKNHSEEMKETKPESLSEHEEIEIDKVTKNDASNRLNGAKVDEESKSSDLHEKEEIENDLGKSESIDKMMIKDSENDENMDEPLGDEFNKCGDLNDEMRTGEEESDDILEESYDDTPLAVSRSASQCTTRRVSSGNLAKLREDPILGWTEEVGQENENEDDPSTSKVKFSGIGGETIKEQGSDEMDHSQKSDTMKEITDDIPTKDSKEYHIYVPEVDTSEGYSTTESSTFDSAVTKIQAGVRGFLTRRRLQRGQQNRSSTLTSIPSIQNSVEIDPWTKEREPTDKEEQHERTEEIRLSSSRISEDNDFVDAATTIQSNYRRYKARKRLRREDAVQRTTLSLEKSFAESGLQHTGEFHDCVPLPIHDITLKKQIPNLPKNSRENRLTLNSPEVDKNDELTRKIVSKNSDENGDEAASKKSNQKLDKDPEDVEKIEETSIPLNCGNMYFGKSSDIPVLQFGLNPNVSQLVDLLVVGKEDSELQSGYLNFITSVEDTEANVNTTGMPLNMKHFHEDERNSNESLKEPLALSGPPVGAIIEEVTSSGAENFMKADEETDRTMASDGSSLMVPEIIGESISSSRAPCKSLETVSISIEGHQAGGDDFDKPELGKPVTGCSAIRDEVEEHLKESDKSFDHDNPEGPQKCSSKVEQSEENIASETESMIEDLEIAKMLTSIQEKELLDPESFVDSMESPVTRPDDKSPSDCSDASPGTKRVEEVIGDKEKKMSDRSEIIEGRIEGESIDSNVDEASSMLSFSMKIEDLLDLGSEDAVEVAGRKPVSEVTLRPVDLRKSMSLSQESQLAGERIESPITMIQIAPERSESLQQDDLSDNGGRSETNGKEIDNSGPAKSEKN